MVKLLGAVLVSALVLVIVPESHGQADIFKGLTDKINEVLGPVFNTIKDAVAKAQCLGNSAQDEPSVKKCQSEATDHWKAEPNVKKQACCQSLAIKQCFMDLAKDKCNENEYKNLDSQLTRGIESQCPDFVKEPSTCGTGALVPLISFVVISLLAVVNLA